jgi:hypothetical protein
MLVIFSAGCIKRVIANGMVSRDGVPRFSGKILINQIAYSAFASSLGHARHLLNSRDQYRPLYRAIVFVQYRLLIPAGLKIAPGKGRNVIS